jgi:hypothetical protein
MTVPQRPRMVFNAFNMFTASHHDQGMCAWPGSQAAGRADRVRCS